MPATATARFPTGASVERKRELARAREFIKDALAAGPRWASEVKVEARADGIKDWALTDARQELAISEKQGFGTGGGWQWRLKARKRPRKHDPAAAV